MTPARMASSTAARAVPLGQCSPMPIGQSRYMDTSHDCKHRIVRQWHNLRRTGISLRCVACHVVIDSILTVYKKYAGLLSMTLSEMMQTTEDRPAWRCVSST